MAVSASFHRNVFLLNQLVPPNDTFKKHFREGMFDKPNTTGFIHVTHYLLTICDAERFRKLVEWPIICKKTEAKYRNDVKDYLNTISLENPDIGFPSVLSTYLHHASGTKFMIVMWKLSQLTLRKYIMRNGGDVLYAPKPGSLHDLTTTYLQQSKANNIRNLGSHHRSCLQMEKAANSALEKKKEKLTKIKGELFDKKQSVTKYIAEAPVAASTKQRLADIEDPEIIQMWRNSLTNNIRYIRKRVGIFKNLERICENINGIISNLLNNSKALDGKQLKEINCSAISELEFPPVIQCCLYELYSDNKLIYNKFISLFTLILCQVYQSLRKNYLADLSQSLLQVKASTEDVKAMYNVFKTLLTGIINYTEEIESVSYDRSTTFVTREVSLPLVKSVLLMPSPLIKINTNCSNEKDDLYKLLQFTPKEIAHKSLFSRYTRHKKNHTPNLKTNLCVSHIDMSDILVNNERKNLSMRFMTPGVNRLRKRATEKYSQLFCTYKNKNARANSSMIFQPSTMQVNSPISTAKKESNLWDHNLDTTTKSLFNLREEPTPIMHCTPIKQSALQDANEQETDDVFNLECKITKPELDELTEIEFINKDNKGTVVKQESTKPKRRSISDLVERYKKVLETSNCVEVKFQKEFMKYESKEVQQ